MTYCSSVFSSRFATSRLENRGHVEGLHQGIGASAGISLFPVNSAIALQTAGAKAPCFLRYLRELTVRHDMDIQFWQITIFLPLVLIEIALG